jgi:hypothetical protein
MKSDKKNKNSKQKNLLFFALLATFGATQKIKAMEQDMQLPGSPEESPIIAFENMDDQLALGIESYAYTSVLNMAQAGDSNPLEGFLSTNAESALEHLTFAIKSLDTFAGLIKIEQEIERKEREWGQAADRTAQKTRWHKLQFNSLRIADLLIKNGAPEDELSYDLRAKLNKFRAQFGIKKVHFIV